MYIILVENVFWYGYIYVTLVDMSSFVFSYNNKMVDHLIESKNNRCNPNKLNKSIHSES